MRKIKISPGQNLWDTMRDGRFTLCATFLMGQWLNYEVRIWLEFNAALLGIKSQFSALTDLKRKKKSRKSFVSPFFARKLEEKMEIFFE